MALIPLLALAARRLRREFEEPKALDPELHGGAAAGGSGHAIVIGHGRVGQIVCAMLERHRFPIIAIDNDPAAVARTSAGAAARSTTATPPIRPS